MSYLFSIAGLLLVLGVIIFVHEMGHLLAAKAFGMKVFVFSFGFGKRLAGFKWGDTDCRLSLVPVGGYVKLEGEPDDQISEMHVAQGDAVDSSALQSPHYFLNRPRWQRFLVYLAGPAMNLILTFTLFTVLFMIGFGVESILTDPPIVGAVEAGSAGAAAGIEPGDRILAIDGKPQPTWESALYNLVLRPGAKLKVDIARGNERKEVLVEPKTDPNTRAGVTGIAPLVRLGEITPDMPAQAAGFKANDGVLEIAGKPVGTFTAMVVALGAAPPGPVSFKIYRDGQILELTPTPVGGKIGVRNKVVVQRFGLGGALGAAAQETWNQTKSVLNLLKGLLTGQMSLRASLAGPVGIARVSGEAIQTGAVPTLQILAMLSISVGILNLFPLVPLDGGHLAIIAAEGIMRREMSLRLKTYMMNAGAVVVLFLIVVTLYSDLSKTSLLGKYLP
jgi:regulator of sigma E protease